MSSYNLPDADELTRSLAMVVAPDAAASGGAMSDEETAFHALYVNREGNVVATCSCDLKASAGMGAALSMIPPGGAESMVEDKELTAMARGNLYEIMNIFSTLLMTDKTPHLKLTDLNEGPAPEVAGATNADYDLDLDKYGPGKLRFSVS